jgi:uncharacterized protein YecT (DUF1311 family)
VKEILMVRLVAVLVFGVFVGPAFADDAPDCNNQKDQTTMTQCAGLDYEAADKELNVVWKELTKPAPDADPEFSAAVLKAQRAWIAYRDGQCEVAGFEARGGSMEPMIVGLCLAEMTRARTKELQRLVDGTGK